MVDRIDSLINPESIVKDNNGYSPDQYLDSKCPILSALMSLTSYKGTSREPCTLLLFADQGRSKVGINDKENERIGWATVDSFEDVFEVVEQLLAEDRIDWRPYRNSGRNQR